MGDKRKEKDARARAAGLRHMGEYNEGHIADLVQPGARADNGKDLILKVKLRLAASRRPSTSAPASRSHGRSCGSPDALNVLACALAKAGDVKIYV